MNMELHFLYMYTGQVYLFILAIVHELT